VAAKLRQFIADETGKDQFLWRNRRNLEEQKVVRKISNPIRIAVCLIFSMTGASGTRKGECHSGFGKRACRFITVKFGMAGKPLEPLHGVKSPNIPEGHWLEKRRGRWRNVERRVPIECGMSSSGNDTNSGQVTVQRTQLRS